MADLAVQQPKSLIRPKSWSAEVENAYRFQLAGYRDETEYVALTKTDVIFSTQNKFKKIFHKKK